ncbi:ABC transporter substrate-binding protein [Nocardia sp. NPDC049220]|uniref:ABC transporter substrate-binding protein n=1 Tax=Nocardia sp. NPDC049220 TaxID=3155273 RepID=UPI0033C5DB2C
MVAVTVAALALVSACGNNSATSAGDSGNATLKIGLFGALSDAGLILAKEHGYFTEQNIDVAFTPSQSAPTIIGLVASGQLDAAGTAPTPGLFNALGSNVSLKIAADKGRIDPTHSWTGLVVHSDGPTSVAELKGKKIALPDLNTSTGAELDMALEGAGISTKDVDLVSGSAADNYSAFVGGAVDAAALQEPFIAQAIATGNAKVLVPFGQVLPNGQNGIMLFGERLSKNTALAKRFMTAYLKGVADYNAAFPTDGSAVVGRDNVVAALIANTAVKKPEVYEAMQPTLFDPTGAVDTASIDEMQKFFVSIGSQQKVIPSSEYLMAVN